jgi:hypothetical protein
VCPIQKRERQPAANCGVPLVGRLAFEKDPSSIDEPEDTDMGGQHHLRSAES